jgi:hypothetical protein
LFVLALAAPTQTQAATFWNESIHGELSNNQAAPSAFTLASGVNSVIGSVNGVSDSQDWLALAVPEGFELSSVVPAAYASSDSVAFTGFQGGSVFLGSSSDPGAYLGYSHFGQGNVGSDLLPAMSAAAGAQGFTSPLDSGTYVFLVQQLGAPATYQFDYVVTPVPEPRAQAAVAFFCAAILLLRRAVRARRQ